MVLNKTLQEIHQGYKNKKNKIFVLNRKSVCSLLDLLIAEGFILKYSKGENNKLSIWLKYEKSTPAIKGVKFYSTCKKQVFINLKKIKSLKTGFLKHHIFLISNNSGILTNAGAVNQKKGGLLLSSIH